jgi:hypothetical protein
VPARHVFQVHRHITEDLIGTKRLSNKFMEFLASQEPPEVHLREASCGVFRCLVEVLLDGQGDMYLDRGFDKFAREPNLEVRCLLHFFYEVDIEMRVKVFDDPSCPKHYHDDDSGDDNGNSYGLSYAIGWSFFCGEYGKFRLKPLL